MRYIVKSVEISLDGGQCGTRYFVCDTEREMERMVNAFKDDQYCTVTCIGPVGALSKWMKEKIEQHV